MGAGAKRRLRLTLEGASSRCATCCGGLRLATEMRSFVGKAWSKVVEAIGNVGQVGPGGAGGKGGEMGAGCGVHVSWYDAAGWREL